MSIVKIEMESGYFMLSNQSVKELMQDAGNWDAMALLAYLVSKPPGWKVSYSGIMSQLGRSRSKISNAIKCLQELGYAKYVQKQDSGKFISGDWYVCGQPIYREESIGCKNPTEDGYSENRGMVYRSSVFEYQVNKEEVKKEKDILSCKQDEVEEAKRSQAWDDVERIFSRLNELTGKRFRFKHSKGFTADAKICLARVEEYSADEAMQVVETMCHRWKGTDQAKYLRPETLFRASKFCGYLGQATSTTLNVKSKNGSAALKF